MKKFVIKCVAFFLIICIIFVPFTLIVDPYNIFHADKLVDNGVEPNKGYVKTMHILNHMEDYDSVIFGSSRVGFFDVSLIPDGKYYDMMSSEAVPAEHYEILKVLIERGFVPKNVLIGVDDISYFVDPKPHDKLLYRKHFPWDGSVIDKMGFYLTYFDPITNIQSLDTILNHKVVDPDWGERLLTTGTEKLDIVPNFDKENEKPYWADYYSPREEVFEDMQNIVDLCKENNINLIVFTNPIYGHTYKQDIENGYLIFLERLADITDYYNFSGFNELTLNNANYYENSHFSTDMCSRIIDVIYNGNVDENLLSQGYGFYVTSENKDELLEILKGQAINYDIEINTYKDTLNREK